MKLLKEVFSMKNLLMRGGSKMGIYGTGLAGKEVFESLERMKIEIDFFLDGDKEKIGTFFCGKEVVDINLISKDTVIIIAANPKYEIHKRIQKAGIECWGYVDPVFLHLYSEGNDKNKIEKIIKANKEKIYMVYEMLQDTKSRKVFQSVLEHRLNHNLFLINEIYDENQYFGNDVIPSVSGNFVDCGAFTGETLKRFLASGGGIQNYYYAFEAEKQNYDTIESFCKKNNLTNIKLYNIAVYDEKKKFFFLQDKNDKKVGGKLSETEISDVLPIQADSLDHVMGNIEIEIITMDIEGAEIHALNGAKKCIQTWHPKLAISAYHDIEHLWEIPLLIKKLNPEYQIFYRHHCWNLCDTVCYAI